MRRAALVACLALSLAACSTPTPYVTASVGSYHVQAQDDFEEFNPGIGAGLDWRVGDWRPGVEAGVYRNSYGDRTLYGIGQAEYMITPRLGVGAFGGVAEYAALTDYHKHIGLPTFGNGVLVAGGMATLDMGHGVSARLRAMPGGDTATAVLGLQLVFHFGQEGGQ